MSSKTQHLEITQPQSELRQSNLDSEKVVILHDSLCGKINNTILSRERIVTKKVWAPDITEMEKKLNEIEKTEVIVLQALTRDLGNKGVNEINERINEVIAKALTKAQKVVISTIVSREDEKQIGAKAELVNAHIKYKYINDKNVIICDNQNLNDGKFRVNDGLHLTPHGISVLATNLKHKIAEAFNISVIKKENTRRNYGSDHRYNNHRDFFNNGYG